MRQLKIYFNILYKECLGKVALKKNKQQLLLYGMLIVSFLLISINFTPSDEFMDYRALNDTIVLGFLQIFSISVISYIFVYMSIDLSYRLNMFFKINFLDDFNLGIVNKILMIVGVHIVSIAIILIQAGIPLLKVLKIHLFGKFIIITIIGINLMFILIDIFVNYLEKKYYEMDINSSRIRVIILSTLSIIYVAIYYTSLKVWYNSLKLYDLYDIFLNTNLIHYIIILIFSIVLVLLYCFKIKNKIIKDNGFNNRYKLFMTLNKKTRYTKYFKLMIRNKKILLTGLFVIAAHMLNFFTVSDLSIANMFSFLSVIIGINFYSYLVNEKIFLKLYYVKDEYKIYFTLVAMYFILNILFIVLAQSQRQYIYIFESLIIYIVSIYLGIVFPRENNSLNKFMSNFILTIIVMALALVSITIKSETIKLGIYILAVVLISIIIIRVIRRIYEQSNTKNII